MQEETLYLEGIEEMQEYWEHGVKGYVSLVGHHDSSYQHSNPKGRYLDEESSSIWLNEQENVYMMDCGCGLPNGRLASICLETGNRDMLKEDLIWQRNMTNNLNLMQSSIIKIIKISVYVDVLKILASDTAH